MAGYFEIFTQTEAQLFFYAFISILDEESIMGHMP